MEFMKLPEFLCFNFICIISIINEFLKTSCNLLFFLIGAVGWVVFPNSQGKSIFPGSRQKIIYSRVPIWNFIKNSRKNKSHSQNSHKTKALSRRHEKCPSVPLLSFHKSNHNLKVFSKSGTNYNKSLRQSNRILNSYISRCQKRHVIKDVLSAGIRNNVLVSWKVVFTRKGLDYPINAQLKKIVCCFWNWSCFWKFEEQTF